MKKDLVKRLKVVKRGKFFIFDMDIFDTPFEFTPPAMKKIDNLLFKSMRENMHGGTGGLGESIFISYKYDKKGIEKVQPLLEEIIKDEKTFRKIKLKDL